jgi:hypothetical protein
MALNADIQETKQFGKSFDKLVGKSERTKLHEFLRHDPQAGAVIRGTHGMRKLRWARPGTGKSGGVRIIYYFYRTDAPLTLLSLFAKNEKENLSDSDVNELAKLANLLKTKYEGERR